MSKNVQFRQSGEKEVTNKNLRGSGQWENSVPEDQFASPTDALERAKRVPSSAFTPPQILALQQSAGNKAVRRLLASRKQEDDGAPVARTVQRHPDDQTSGVRTTRLNRNANKIRALEGIQTLQGPDVADLKTTSNVLEGQVANHFKLITNLRGRVSTLESDS